MTDYKENQITNLQWFGVVPSDWKIKRFKYLTQPRKELSKNGEEELLSVTEVRGIIKRRELKSDNENLSRSEDLTGYKNVKKGDLVSNIMLVWKRGLGVSKYNGIVSPAYSVFSFSDECHPNFYNYLVRSDEYINEFRKHSTGITMSRLRLYDDAFGAVFAHVPPIKDQKLISRYLDKKTEQIDKLIEKIRLKIHLLDEKQASLIKQCVVEDFTPHVAKNYNNSKIIKKKIKYLFKIRKGVIPQILNNKIEKDNFPYLSMNVLRGERPTEFTKIDNCIFVSKGDIGILWDGSNAGEIIKINLDGVLSSTVAFLEIKNSNLDQNFAFFVLKFHENLIKFNINGMGIPHVDGNFLKNIEVYLPSINIQKKVVKELETKLSESAKLRSCYFDKILLLKEYRQSLISSTVTGKVRISENMV